MALDIGARIVELRTARGLSQEALANQLGLSRQAVSRWERGEALPDTENLIALADLFEVTLDDLVRPRAADASENQAAPTEEAALEAEPEIMAEGKPEPEAADAPTPELDSPTPPSTSPYVPPSETPPVATPRNSRWTTGCVVALVAIAFVAGSIVLAFLTHLVLGVRWMPDAPEVISETTDDYVWESDVTIDSQDISSIELSWPSGDVSIIPVDDRESGGEIRLLENIFERDTGDALSWEIDDGRLTVFADPGISYIGRTSLALMVPTSVLNRLDSVSVEVLAGSLSIENMDFNDLDVTIGSGSATMYGVTAHSFDLEVASGEALVDGSFASADIEVGSGHVEATLADVQHLTDLSLELASGSLVVMLPEGAGFTLVEESTGPGHVRVSEFEIVYNGRAGTTGDGAITIDAEVASGTIDIVSYPE